MGLVVGYFEVSGVRGMLWLMFSFCFLVGVLFLGVTCVALFSGVQVMFEWREMEKRRGWKVEK